MNREQIEQIAHCLENGRQCDEDGTDTRVSRQAAYEAAQLLRAHLSALDAQGGGQIGERLWLWKNFVDGKPEYWAFDNAYPTYAGGDPMTLGSPCGYALVRPSTPGKPDIQDSDVLAEIARSTPSPAAVQALREALGLLRDLRHTLPAHHVLGLKIDAILKEQP